MRSQSKSIRLLWILGGQHSAVGGRRSAVRGQRSVGGPLLGRRSAVGTLSVCSVSSAVGGRFGGQSVLSVSSAVGDRRSAVGSLRSAGICWRASGRFGLPAGIWSVGGRHSVSLFSQFGGRRSVRRPLCSVSQFGSRRSAVSGRQSAVGGRQSAVGGRKGVSSVPLGVFHKHPRQGHNHGIVSPASMSWLAGHLREACGLNWTIIK
jgi:hypothetical protein